MKAATDSAGENVRGPDAAVRWRGCDRPAASSRLFPFRMTSVRDFIAAQLARVYRPWRAVANRLSSTVRFKAPPHWDLGRAPAGGRRPATCIVATLTGLGPDAGTLSETVTLDTHIRDVVDLLHRHDLRDVVLVGHSYGGMIVTGVAEHARDRIGHLVYVDALVPEHGQSALDIMTVAMADTFRQMAAEGSGWRMRATGKLVDKWGLEEGPPRAASSRRACATSPCDVSISRSRLPPVRLPRCRARTSRASRRTIRHGSSSSPSPRVHGAKVGVTTNCRPATTARRRCPTR